jgi:hypothetical protein
MTIELNVYTDLATNTERRIFEMLTENTGKHFLDSGMSDGRHWQQNQKLTVSDFMKRPKATIDTEYYPEITLDLFHFLNERLTLTALAETLQSDWEHFINSEEDRSFYSCADMEDFVKFVTDSDEATIANSYNWDNYLSQTIQYVDFHLDGRSFTLLQIHGGADVRGGYTAPQVFETTGELWSYSMQNVTIQCTNKECDFYLDVYGCVDVTDSSGSLWDGNFNELKVCPECQSTLEAIAPCGDY